MAASGVLVVAGQLCALPVVLATPAPTVAAASNPPTEAPAADSDAARADRLNAEALQAIRSDLIRAESLSRQALAAARAGGAAAAEALANVNLARIARYRGNYGRAIELYSEARQLSERAGDAVGLARLAADLAILYSVAGLNDDALTEANKARDLFASQNNPGSESSVLITLGNIHSDRGDNQLARESYEQALAIKQAAGIEKGVGIAINNLAELELEDGDYAQALEHIDEAIRLDQAQDDDVSLSMALSNRAVTLAHLERFDEARRTAQQAGALADRVGMVRMRLSAETAMVAVLRLEAATASPAHARELLERAGKRQDDALALLVDTDDDGRREDVLRDSSELAELLGDYPKALKQLREAEALESRRKEEIDNARSDVLAARFRSDQQLAEIRSLREQAGVSAAELESQRLYRRLLLVALLGTAMVLTLFGLGLMQYRRSGRALARSNQALSAALAEASSQRGTAQLLARENAEVLRVAAQDLQEPLLEIRSRAERLMANHAVTDDLRNQIALISTRSATAAQTVRNLIETDELDRDGENSGPGERIDLNALVTAVVEQLRPSAAAKRQQIDCELPSAPLQVTGRRERLSEALEHLIDNAIKFGPFEQRIELRLLRDDRLSPPSAVIQVSDQGPGLRSADHERLFGRFQRLSARPTAGESSAGLGLALTKRIVERHGGRIDAGNAPGGGAEFRLTLPLA
ncbi:MAG TPA: tetratricopeptide repeat-containing sensor histidine kinase [Xanthomonadaceae bacterium]|nr:tetratricopeptide repeat-containing sensor histidine kinase [Xanthomonadaceae bacterium]HRX99433.1 tetratricopeptide repeat-containing sensor histidine kinase [Xanthomonadaceae bacterium]